MLELGCTVHVDYRVYINIYIYSSPGNFITVLSSFVIFFRPAMVDSNKVVLSSFVISFRRAMVDSNKVEGLDEDDHHRPFDYTHSKREEETTGHAGDEEEGHDDDDYTDSKKEEVHDAHDDRPFDYSFIVLTLVANAFLRNG